MQSCIYEGRVRHARSEPVPHRFGYRVFMMYLDLGELDDVFDGRWFWSTRRVALARFRRENYLGPSEQSLAESVRDLVEQRTGQRPAGPIRMLTNLSYFGYCFNPVTHYYCYDGTGRRVETIVADVTNTPWGEREAYVLPAGQAEVRGNARRFRDAKALHVSPFMPMDMQYDWCFTDPGHQLVIHMTSSHKGKRVFGASVALRRVEIGAASLARTLVRYPFMTARIIVAIHWQALRLWLKKCPVHEHPNKRHKIAVSSR